MLIEFFENEIVSCASKAPLKNSESLAIPAAHVGSRNVRYSLPSSSSSNTSEFHAAKALPKKAGFS